MNFCDNGAYSFLIIFILFLSYLYPWTLFIQQQVLCEFYRVKFVLVDISTSADLLVLSVLRFPSKILFLQFYIIVFYSSGSRVRQINYNHFSNSKYLYIKAIGYEYLKNIYINQSISWSNLFCLWLNQPRFSGVTSLTC